MKREIDTITVSAVEDRRLVLGDAQVARTLSFGSSWNAVRIGMRVSIKDDSANLIGNPRLYFGLMSSPSAGCANGPLGVTSHFLGVKSQASSWTRSVAAGVTYYSVATAFAFTKQVGVTETTPGNSGSWVFPTSTTDGWFFPIYLDITKGSPNFTVLLTYWNQTVDNVAVSKTDFARSMEIRSTSTASGLAGYLNALTGVSNYNTSSGSIAVDEGANGSLNAIVVGWDRGYVPIYISDIGWSKLA